MNDNCPKCKSENTYQDGILWICPKCSYEWIKEQAIESEETTIDTSIRDANGNILIDGDSVIVIKDLKIKGASSTVKGGTKVRNIRLYDAGDGHNISCKIEGLGSMNLKSEFVRKC
ncbi:MAG: zinc ribbon domain-containing protein YjdM [Bdellovibrionota bacterium]